MTTPADRDFEQWWEERGGFPGAKGLYRTIYLAGRAAGLRAALTEHDRPGTIATVAREVEKELRE